MKRRHVALAILSVATAGCVGLAAIARDDEALRPPADAAQKLNALLAKPKFLAEPAGLYTGVRDERQRRAAEATINEVIRSTLARLSKAPDKRLILGDFEAGLNRITLADTEDRERAAHYIEEIMECIGLESSDGLLNTWLYGFDPGKAPAT